MFHVVVGNPQIAPGGRKGRIELSGPLPLLDRVAMASAVIEKIAEIVWRASISGIRGNRCLKHLHLFKPVWKYIGRIRCCGLSIEVAAPCNVTPKRRDKSASI